MKNKMYKFFYIVLSFAIIISTISIVPITATEYEKQYCNASLDDEFTDNEVIIVIMPFANFVSYSINDFSEVHCTQIQELSYQVTENDLCRIIKLTLSEESKQNVLDSIKILEMRNDIYSAEPNYIGSFDMSSQDPYYLNDQQWAIDNISLEDAWNVSNTSTTVLVGVIDTGIDASHEDLAGKVNTTLSKSFTTAFSTGIEDTQGHGTHVAGIIGARINNKNSDNQYVGIAGVSPKVELVSLRVVKENNRPDSAAIISAIGYASIHNIPILNCSIGWNYIDYEEISSLSLAINNYNGLLICAAGNSGADNNTYRHYPSDTNTLSNVISVGASNIDDQKWSSSNYGATSVDLFAPGQEILSTFPTGVCLSSSHKASECHAQGYHVLDGTSMAAPYVTGVAALMLTANPNLQAYQIKDIILRSVDVVDAFENLCLSGGRLNAYKAVNTARMLYLNCSTTYDSLPNTNALSASSHIVYYDICSECSCDTFDGSCNDCGICDPCEDCHASYTELHNYRVIDYSSTQHTLYCDDCDTTNIGVHELYIIYEEDALIVVKCKYCSYIKYCENYVYNYQNSTYHTVRCNACSYLIEEPHQFGAEEIANDSTNHYAVCLDCDYRYLEAHVWFIAPGVSQRICILCEKAENLN